MTKPPPLSPAAPDRPRVRLFVEQPLGQGQQVSLSQAASHYLFAVMRLGAGGRVALFDGANGEWCAEITDAGKKRGSARCIEQTAPQRDPSDLWLLFAPIKKARTDFIVEKATELGAARICPVQSDFTNAERIRRDRLQAHAVEAAEQCGGTFVPPVDDLRPLGAVLDVWPGGRTLFWCDEALAGAAGDAATAPTAGPAAILIGPEGGFSPAERARLAALPFLHRLALGPRILRADTAAVAALTLWQARFGDWGATGLEATGLEVMGRPA
ncbi:MAG: 16S rRNA (uracil(1498)-N(3))-methyltransferase [Pararhodobacter sp.]|nr:16S rRNA (uracil(1498)-N(3))-methyltransferase [Pararhodobacter sp.]